MFRRFSLVLVLVVFGCAISLAQNVANSRVTGIVTDPSGASIPGAQVQMTQSGTGLVRKTTTNGDGSYTLPDLPLGSYQLDVTKDGFSTYEQSGIVLQVGSNPTVNAQLQVGSISQKVEVTADSTVIETHSNSIGQVVNQQEVLDIPLNARDPMQLLSLTPAAVVSSSGSFNSSLNFPNPYTIAFAGTNPGAGTYLLDGGNDNDQATGDSFPLPFPDALGQFKVDTSAVPAEYGMHSAATVNAVTKSGSNQFHGDAFEFVRNYLFNAKQFYSPVRDPLKRNQFGGVIGGPVIKDKLFFFAAFQDTIVRSQTPNSAVLPTADELAGNFKPVLTPQPCNNFAPKTFSGTNYPNGTIDPSTYSTPAVNLAKLLPTPSDACGTYNFQAKIQTNAQQVVGRLDYHLNEKHTLFARYYLTNYSQPADATNFQTLNVIPQQDTYQSVTAGETYLITNSIVNSFHANLNRASNRKDIPPGVVTPTQLGVGGNYFAPYPGYLSVTVTGAFMVKGAIGVPVFFNDTDFQLADDVEVSKGAHQIAFGGEWVHFNTDSTSPIYENGVFTFSGQTTGLPIADFLLGDLSQFQKGNAVYNNNRKNFFALYAQDSWQAGRKLTFNYGVRWEPFLPYHQSAGEGYNFDLATFQAGTHSKVFPNAPAGLRYPGGDYAGYGNSYLGNMKHFEPRIGFTYDPRGKGREVIRASYGTFYDFVGFMIDQNIRQSPPWADSIIRTGVNFTNPFAGYTYNGNTGVDPFPIQPSANLVYPNAGAYETYSELNVKAPMLQQWNLSVQKQIGQSWSLTASYVGNHGTHNATDGELNPGIYAAGATSANVQARRRLTMLNATQGPFYSAIADVQDNGVENYHGAILTLTKQMSNNFSLVTNYTYGHCTDNGEPTATFTSSGWRNDISKERGACTWDHRQQLTITGLVQSPKFGSRVTEAILGHWQLAPIISFLSGDHLTITTGVDTALVGISAGQRPDAVAGVPVYVAPTHLTNSARWFNPKAFATPTAPAGFTGNVINNGSGSVLVGPVGNLARGTLVGPSNTDFDLALTRIIKIENRHEVDLRFEAFNVFNVVRYYDPTTTMSSTTFGNSVAPTTAPTPGFSAPQDPRIMQFAVKYVF